MLWFFTKGEARLRVLTSRDAGTGDYLVEIAWPDRKAETRRFVDKDGFSAYLTELENELDTAHWVPSGVRPAGRKPSMH